MTLRYVTRSHTKRIATWLVLLAAAAPLALARQDDTRKQEDAQPITWGVMGQTPGCVIFSEGRKNSGHFSLNSNNKNLARLTVLEGQHYTLDQKEYLETQENLDALMHRAQKDHIKYVKIPEKYSPELLDKARTACKQDQ